MNKFLFVLFISLLTISAIARKNEKPVNPDGCIVVGIMRN